VTTLQTTAILKTDLSGSTPRFRELSEAEVGAFLREHRALVARLAAAHDGRIVKPEGDGFWLAFPSVTAAALAAMSMQEEVRLAQANKADDDRFRIRIVITLGDVLHQEGALVGDAVVLATRIEALTPPAESYVAGAAWLAMNRAEVRTSFVDAFALKGFVEPAAVYRVEQTHRTRVITDQYIVVTDLKGFTRMTEASPLATSVVEAVLDGLHDMVGGVCHEFGGVVRFNAGDAYCLTFPDAGRAMAGLQHLAAEWAAFARRQDVPCPINVGVHKGTLHAFRSFLYGRDLLTAFRVESASTRQHLGPGEGGIFVSGPVRDDLLRTPWEGRLERVDVVMAAPHENTMIYRLRPKGYRT
jgi:class 3 adenylate cyclase